MNAPFRATTRPGKLRLRVEDFLLLDAKGAFDAFSKTELIEGEIWYMNAQHIPHARIKTQMGVAFANALLAMGSELAPIIEVSTRISDYSLPEPDIVLTDGKGDDKGQGIVVLESVALIVEVADTTLRIDMGRKLRIYADASVPEYWVVDLKAKLVRQMWAPSNGGYTEKTEVALGGVVEAVTIKGLRIGTQFP